MGSRRDPGRARAFVLLGAAAALFVIGGAGPDPDLFWHLRVAELLAETGPRALVDSFSYNSVSQPWIPYSWLAERTMARAVEVLGASATLLIPLVAFLATLGLLAPAVFQRSDTAPRALAVLSAVALLLIPFATLRPATLALPACALTVWWVVAPPDGRRALWTLVALIPVTALTANTHLYFVFTPLVLCVWGAGALLRGDAAMSVIGRYLVTAALCLAAALLLNPFGVRLLDVMTHYLFQDPMIRQRAILEMQPFYSLGPLVALGAASLVLWTVSGFARKRPDAPDLALLALSLALLLARGRYVPLAALTLAPVTARYAPWPRLGAAAARRWRAVTVGAAVGLYATAAGYLLRGGGAGDLSEQVAGAGYPVAAAEFVRDSLPRRTGRLINGLDWGGYLIYALWPDYRVMVDGRTQLYPRTLWRELYLEASDDTRASVFRRSDADAAVLPARSGWAVTLERRLGWKVVYRDDVAAVWAPPEDDGALGLSRRLDGDGPGAL